jgi:hypothetical protein
VTGEKCTITPNVKDIGGGAFYIDLSMSITSKSGDVLPALKMTVKSGNTAIFNAALTDNFGGINLQITPYVEGGLPPRANPSKFVVQLSFDGQKFDLITPSPPSSPAGTNL